MSLRDNPCLNCQKASGLSSMLHSPPAKNLDAPLVGATGTLRSFTIVRPRLYLRANGPITHHGTGRRLSGPATREKSIAPSSLSFIRNDSVLFGAHTRLRLCRPAPSPVGPEAYTQWCGLRTSRCVLRGRGTQHARARVLPISIESFRLIAALVRGRVLVVTS